MRCPHCSTVVKFDWKVTSPQQITNYDDEKEGEGIEIFYGDCPSCAKLVVGLQEGLLYTIFGNTRIDEVISTKIIYPKTSDLSDTQYIPSDYIEDYQEAVKVLPASPKASAALSRRLLQSTLRDHFKIEENSLAKEIEKFTQLPGIPSHITDAVDAVRQIGNIAAHPTKDKNTGQIVAIEPGEAEWLIEVIEALFDFAFIQPVKLRKRKEELNLKLQNIGKPQMK